MLGSSLHGLARCCGLLGNLVLVRFLLHVILAGPKLVSEADGVRPFLHGSRADSKQSKAPSNQRRRLDLGLGPAALQIRRSFLQCLALG